MRRRLYRFIAVLSVLIAGTALVGVGLLVSGVLSPTAVAASALALCVLACGLLAWTLRHANADWLRRMHKREALAEQAKQLERLGHEQQQQNQRLSQLLATTQQGCWFIDENHITVDLNPAMCELLGRSRESLIGRCLFDVFSGEDLRTIQREVQSRRSGQRSTYEITIARPDGTVRMCLNHASPLHDAEGRHIGSVGLWTDITDVVKTTRELRLHAWAINSVAAAVSVVDENEIFLMVNDAWCKNTGVSREQALGRHPRDFLPILCSPERSAAVRECLRSNSLQTVKMSLPLPGLEDRKLVSLFYPCGSEAYEGAPPDGVAKGLSTVVIVTRESTRQEQLIHQMQLAEAEQRALLDAFPGFITRLDMGMVYRFVNTRLATLMGTTPEAMIGRSIDELFGSERAAVIRSELAETRALGPIVADRRIRGLNGQPDVHVQITTALGRDPVTGDDAFYAFGIDVTGLHRARQAMDEARAEAERANRAKSRFLAQMSHELRTPLNAILGFAQLLETDELQALNAQGREHVRQIHRGGEHLLGLINEMLELGRIESGELALDLQPVPLAAMLSDSLELMRPLALARGVQLQSPRAAEHGGASAQDAALCVTADRRRLKQVLLNLLGNAVKYNQANGSVTLSWFAMGSSVRINVRDTGPGIAAADQERVFEPFERLGAERGAVEGTGIGLALSRRLIGAMGGHIGLDSQPGVGSTFWLTLPLAAEASLTNQDAAVAPEVSEKLASLDRLPAPTGQPLPLVLYVEDNPVNLLLMEAMLARLPEVRGVCVMSPTEGLAVAVREKPALVLLDLQMPEMDGFQVLRHLRSVPATSGIPVYALSANAHRQDIDAALAAGFDGYLTKPIDLQTLGETVRARVLRPVPAPASLSSHASPSAQTSPSVAVLTPP